MLTQRKNLGGVSLCLSEVLCSKSRNTITSKYKLGNIRLRPPAHLYIAVLSKVVLNLVVASHTKFSTTDRAGGRRRDRGRGHRRGRDPGAASSLPVSVP